MNRPGDPNDHSDDGADFEQLFAAAIGDEPPMDSMPADDLSRGRKLVRRRRTGALMTCAAAIPAVALVGWTLTSGGPSQGSGPSVISPADSSDDSTDDCAVLTLDDLSSPPAPGLVEGNAGGKAIEKDNGGVRVFGSNANLDETTGPGDPADAPSMTCVAGALTEVCSFDAGADTTGGTTEDKSGDKSERPRAMNPTTQPQRSAPPSPVTRRRPRTQRSTASQQCSTTSSAPTLAEPDNSAMMGMSGASGSSDDEGASEVGALADWTADADHAGGLGLSLAKDISAMDACQSCERVRRAERHVRQATGHRRHRHRGWSWRGIWRRPARRLHR